jgi:hypothetical protein
VFELFFILDSNEPGKEIDGQVEGEHGKEYRKNKGQ